VRRDTDVELVSVWAPVPFPARGADLALQGDEVHVWHAELEPIARELASLHDVLDAEERARADRFVFDRHRRRYVASHILLRHVLGGYVGLAPEALRFARARHGKPYLVNGAVRFNLAHSGDRALLAVSVGRELGIDLERVRADRDVVGIAGHFFSAAEAAALKALPAHQRVAAFYRCWTRKEAYIKACGTGLAMRLDSFDVAFEPGVPAALLESARGADELRRWRLVELPVGPGFEAALAVEGDGWRLVMYSLADET
jgi:4'-phosphopantetheinyl transferase